jgi:hypothetical protein
MKLTNPTTKVPPHKEMLLDAEFLGTVEDTLHNALNSTRGSDGNVTIQKIKDCYGHQASNLAEYNRFASERWKTPEAEIGSHLRQWEELSNDQKMGFGLWCAHKGTIKL